MKSRLVYLHGFASGPGSQKARFFRDRFRERGAELEIPDLAPDFEHLTLTGQIGILDRVLAGAPAALIGSSLGGYLAALYAGRHPEVERLVLLAPAFGLFRRWHRALGEEKMQEWKRTGSLEFHHYGEGRTRRLHYGFVEDGLQYPDAPAFPQPALIFHGTRDTEVPPQFSEQYAATHPNAHLRLLDSDHQLLDALDPIWRDTQPFLLSADL